MRSWYDVFGETHLGTGRGRGSRAILRVLGGWISPTELLLLGLVALLVFGPKRLPEIGRSLGNGLREFKRSIGGEDDDVDSPADPAELVAPTPREHDGL